MWKSVKIKKQKKHNPQKKQLTMYTETQNHGENTSQNNTELIEREKIEGTPFTLIKQEEKWFITMGDHRITEPTKHKNEQYNKLEKEKWLIITNVIIIILEKMNEGAILAKAYNGVNRTEHNDIINNNQ